MSGETFSAFWAPFQFFVGYVFRVFRGVNLRSHLHSAFYRIRYFAYEFVNEIWSNWISETLKKIVLAFGGEIDLKKKAIKYSHCDTVFNFHRFHSGNLPLILKDTGQFWKIWSIMNTRYVVNKTRDKIKRTKTSFLYLAAPLGIYLLRCQPLVFYKQYWIT